MGIGDQHVDVSDLTSIEGSGFKSVTSVPAVVTPRDENVLPTPTTPSSSTSSSSANVNSLTNHFEVSPMPSSKSRPSDSGTECKSTEDTTTRTVLNNVDELPSAIAATSSFLSCEASASTSGKLQSKSSEIDNQCTVEKDNNTTFARSDNVLQNVDQLPPSSSTTTTLEASGGTFEPLSNSGKSNSGGDVDEHGTIYTDAVPIDPSSSSWLPSTVTVLRNEMTHVDVYLIGTAHFSRESQDDVSRVIRHVRPNIVLIELCRNRAAILSMDEETIEHEAKNISFDKVKSIIRQNGLVQGVMYVLFLNMSAQLTKKLGMAPGGEFRRALTEIKQLDEQCTIHFGDRPIHVTIQRALSCLSWWQTIKLFSCLLVRDVDVSAQDVEKCKQKDMLEQMLDEMADEYPELGKVFVNERDLFLTWSLQYVSQLQTVNNCVVVDNIDIDPSIPREPVRVVGIVGIGHVPGIKKLWGTVRKEDIGPILYIPPPSRSSRMLKVALKLSLYGAVVWGVTKLCPNFTRQAVQSIRILPKLIGK